MGTSSDAILCYGVPLAEETKFDELESAIKQFNLNLIYHCSSDYAMYIIAIPETETIAYRGYQEAIDVIALAGLDTKNWDKKLKQFVKKYDLPTEGEPGWWLASYLG